MKFSTVEFFALICAFLKTHANKKEQPKDDDEMEKKCVNFLCIAPIKNEQKKALTFPLRTYTIPLCSKREKNCISSTNFPLRVYKLLLWIDHFLCVALYLVDGSIAVHLTFALNGFLLFLGISVMWCEAPTKAYLIGISVSYRLTSQMSIIKFVFKMSTLHNKNGNKSHAVEESHNIHGWDLDETLKSVSSVADVCVFTIHKALHLWSLFVV